MKNSKFVASLKSATCFDEIVSMGKLICDMAAFLNPSRIKRGRVETFDEARTRLRVSNEDIWKARKCWAFCFWGVFCVWLAGLALNAAFFPSSSLLQALSIAQVFGFSVMCFAEMFRASFRVSQIEAKKHHSVKYWASKPSLWMPALRKSGKEFEKWNRR